MKDEEKTKDQLIEELLELRQRISELENTVRDSQDSGDERSESEERLKTMFESAPDAYYLIDMQGNFVNGNRAAEDIIGYKMQELIGKNLLSSRFLPPDQIPRAAEVLAKNELGNATGPDEFLLTRNDGTQVAVEVRACPVRIKEEVLVLSIARDITVRKRADAVLQRVQNELEKRLAERTAGISSANEHLNREISQRKRAEEALQRIRDELGEQIEESNIALSNANEQLNLEISERKKAEEKLQRVRDELEERLQEQNAELSHANELLKKEISERKQAQAALKESEEKGTAVLGTDGYYETDIAGNLTFFNDSFTQIWGYPEDELMGMNNREYTDKENAKKIYQTFNRVYTSGERVKAFDCEIIRQDGAIRSIESSVTLMKDAEGHRVGFRGTVRDATEKKKLESQLKEAEKMEAIGTLAGGIAHDFNNLLMGMQGNASLMLLDINSSHPHYEKLKNIEQHVQSGADLTKQLLGFAGGGKYDVKPTNLNDLVKETSEAFGRTKKEINIHTNYQEDIWTVDVDRGQIRQVLSNLYDNSWQAMPGGGDLYLETENVILDEYYYVQSYGVEPGKYVKISITDTGVGMDEATKQRVFEPFFTTKEMGRGTGLGLASCYGVVRNHEGIINIHSKKGKGTTFNIYLPSAEKGIKE